MQESQEKEHHNKLTLDQDRLERIENVSRLGTWVFELGTNTVSWSSGLFKMFGMKPDHPPPNFDNHPELFTETSWQQLSSAVEKAKFSGSSYELELEFIKTNGKHGWMLARGEAIYTDDVITHLKGVAIDVTKRKESELRVLNLVDAAPNAFILVDLSGEILLINSQAEKVFGYTRDELLGKKVECLIPQEKRDKHIGLRDKFLEAPATRQMGAGKELFGLRKNGEIFPIEVGLSPTKYGGNTEVLASIIDITERKVNELEKASLRDMLYSAQKMESIGRLAGGIAHDSNNILTIILGQTDLLLSEIDESSPLTQQINQIKIAAERSAKLNQQLLGYARGQATLPKVLDLNASVINILSMLQRLISQNIQLIWKPGTNMHPIFIDPSQLDQLLTNLCINASDAINNTGKITIETSPVYLDKKFCRLHGKSTYGDFVCLSISDDGCGIPENVMQNIFEPFFSTKDVGKNSGLGLATVYGIVQQNYGIITVASEPDKGAVFKIFFPAHSDLENAHDDATPAMPEIHKDQVKTILIVDDDNTVLELVRRMIENMGYNVIATENGNKAIGILKSNAGTIDLLLSDIIMPEMTGVDLVNHVSDFDKDMKFIFMSGYAANIIGRFKHDLEKVVFLQKPFTIHELQTSINQALNKH